MHPEKLENIPMGVELERPLVPIFLPGNLRTEAEIKVLAERMPSRDTKTIDPPVVQKLIAPKLRSTSTLRTVRRGLRQIQMRRKRREETNVKQARIIAVIPTYETEGDIDLAIENLLMQNREIDRIVVVINGPGKETIAYDRAIEYAKVYPRLIVEKPDIEPGKVSALNWAFRTHVVPKNYDFFLGIDADVLCDAAMTAHLEEDLIKQVGHGCVMARYGFLYPEDTSGKSRSLLYGQRHEFATTGIRHQLRKNTSDIAGGQGTLFRVEALKKVAEVTYGGGPWDPRSKVEDAELTRSLQLLDYKIGTSHQARAWVGPMFTGYTWHKQRRKWQDGHIEDMMRDVRPVQDWRRWYTQASLGWNVAIRVLFVMLLCTSLALEMLVLRWYWAIPIVCAVVQSLLVALKIPDRSPYEVVRSLLYVPGEIYFQRTLAVWISSVSLVIVNVKQDGWLRQAKAEASTKKYAISGWAILIAAVAVPSLLMIVAATVLPVTWVSAVIAYLWNVLFTMTVISTIVMVVSIFKTLRHFGTLQP